MNMRLDKMQFDEVFSIIFRKPELYFEKLKCKKKKEDDDSAMRNSNQYQGTQDENADKVSRIAPTNEVIT